jgi:hypothetical protein
MPPAHKPLAFAQAQPVSEGSDGALIQLKQKEAAMCKLMVVVTRFLPLCAVLLAISAVATAQPIPLGLVKVALHFCGYGTAHWLSE